MRPRTVLSEFALAVTILTFLAQGQTQESSRPYKWLDRDIDWIFSEPIVGPDFLLKVSFHGAPVVGTPIVLNRQRGTGEVPTAKTDARGIAHFRAVPKGKYYANSRDGLLFPSRSFEIEVKPEHTPRERIEIEWPGDSIPVRVLRGRFSISDELSSPEIPLRNATVELRDLRTSRLIESVHTDANGDYEFVTKDSGLYALRLTLPKNGEAGSEHHDLAVELDPTADENSIPQMKAVQSECAGLQLFRRSQKDDTWEAQ